MSNTQVGNVYQQIIADVVDSSRVDFEEGGVDEQVLEELKKGWQQKLTQLNVALFPWDPKPEQQPMQNPPTVPSNYQHPGPPLNQPIYQTPMPHGPRIKTEPSMETHGFLPLPMSQPPPHNPLMTMPNASPAQQRAAQNLHASYGQRAAASIQSIQGSGAAPQQQGMSQLSPQQQQAMHAQQQQHLQMQQMQQQRPSSGVPSQQPQGQSQSQQSQQAAAAYRQNLAAQQAQQLLQQQQQQQQQQQRSYQNAQNAQNVLNDQNAQNGQNGQAPQAPQNPQNPQGGVGSAQTDGAGGETGDSIGVIKQFDSRGDEIAMGRVEIDNLIRDKIESMGKAMEGGGLMLPLREATKISSNKQRQRKTLSSSVPQTDGPGSNDDDERVKEELDEDAINSDLDDPDDGLNDDEDDDEGMGHIMLCMYDKVQRVKNKWKCVMKDGVLTVNGKEYVFHKATGEYEW
ncbi:hypothetical protein SBOR_0818 [Sclerotinia borealis F-4128]|uniref:Transcription initiation factor IIA large subunit n=1 Tax=Sclerotinia borealis (strain F-4128) TaxID=1432307 RepID=W9CPT8_SCLBF|nr:hypothetical protein SBOR_0818 [Sclerotinia borealis F-4128]